MKFNVNKCVFGQYVGYTEELGSNSKTETYASIILEIELDIWKNVPVVLSDGKGLQSKNTEVSFVIKKES